MASKIALGGPAQASEQRALLVTGPDDASQEVVELCARAGWQTSECGNIADIDQGWNQAIGLILIDLSGTSIHITRLVRFLAAARATTPIILIGKCGFQVLRATEELARLQGLNVVGRIARPLDEADFLAALDRAQAFVAPNDAGAFAAVDLEAIRDGMAQRQFSVFFQPQLDLETGICNTVSALLRWQHPDLGLLAPDRFLPLLHGTDDGEALRRSVFRTALNHVAGWRSQGLELAVSLNLSALSLPNWNLAGETLALAKDAGVAPPNVILELPEHQLSSNYLIALDHLLQLRMAGFGVSISHFGSAYASLGRLAKIPASQIKLDRQFLQDAACDPSALAVLESCIDLCHKFDLYLVGFGVEHEAHLEMVRSLGCNAAQGFLIGQPMPSNAIPEWMESYSGGLKLVWD